MSRNPRVIVIPITALPWVWMVAGALVFLGAGLLAGLLVFAVTSFVVAPAPGSGSGLPWLGAAAFAGWLAAWGVLAIPVPALVTRAVYGGSFGLGRPALLSIAGLALASLVGFAIHEWVRHRLGYFAPEFAGPSLLLAPALLAVATLSEAVTLARGFARRLASVCQLVGVGAIAVVLVLNLPGVLDGLRPGSYLVAVGFGLTALWAILAAAENLRRVRAGSSEPPSSEA